MAKYLQINGENIQLIYEWYKKDILIVNRKYQRKLVWNIYEKQALIDSIKNSFSVPLFLVATKNDDTGIKYEVIDGMQRLNAIVSFIEGEFAVMHEGREQFFDLRTMATSNDLLDSKELIQKEPILDRKICSEIVNYQLPFSKINFEKEAKIEEIFRRINSFGRQLSKQDLRQAGSLGLFQDLVRIISSNVRRDSSTTDVLALSKMKEISLSNKDLGYGININRTFWVKHKIILESNMRLSRDEEVIAYLLVYILCPKDTSPSSKTLDKLYSKTSYSQTDFSIYAEQEIEKYGQQKFINIFQKVFDKIESILNEAKTDFRTLIFKGDLTNGTARSFQVIFLAIYELMIIQKKEIHHHTELIKLLGGIGNNHLDKIGTGLWNAKFRNEKISSIISIIQHCFIDMTDDDPTTDMWIGKMENLLSQSKIEQDMFDFKIGLHDLDMANKLNRDLVSKIIKTLTAMANLGPKKVGYIIVGIADNKSDHNRYKSIYNNSARIYNNRTLITGVQDEIIKHYKDGDGYISAIRAIIKKEPIEDYWKDEIIRKMRLISYFDKEILIFEIMGGKEPVLYDNQFYQRVQSHLFPVEQKMYNKLFTKFLVPSIA